MAQMAQALSALAGQAAAPAPAPAPAPPAAPMYAPFRPQPRVPYKKIMETILSRFKPVSTSNTTNWRLLQHLFRNETEEFEVSSEIHNSTDGTQTYFSARAVLESWLHLNVHFIGVLRGTKFLVNKIEVFGADKSLWLTAEFRQEDESRSAARSVYSDDY